jgi:hypothetical protein
MGYRNAEPDPDARGQRVEIDDANDPIHRPTPPPPPVITGRDTGTGADDG